MPESISPTLIARYLSGECDAAESAEVERWIAADPMNAALIDSMRPVWARPAAPEFDADDAVWKRIAARMEIALPRPALMRRRTPESLVRIAHTSRWERWRGGAAAAAVLILIGGFTLWHIPASTPTKSSAPAAPTMREIVTKRGQQAVLDLADGSRVRLGPESRLRIPSTLGDASGARDVSLEGMAFFTVTHDSTRPFRVHTSSGIAEDLGTEFIVNDYPETHGMRVVVESGMVSLRRPTDVTQVPTGPPLVILTRGMLARLDTAGTATVVQNIDPDDYVAWTHGTLAFKGAPLYRVIAEVSRWYDLDITLTDSALADQRVTASFEGESASRVVQRLAIAMNLRAERHGRTVVFHPRSAN